MTERSVLTRRPEAAAREGRPLIENLRGWAHRSRERFKLHVVGPDLDERLAHLRAHYDSESGDLFGLNVETFAQVTHFFGALHRLYFRTEVHGIERLPEKRVLLVSNHSGQIPFDAVMLGCSLFFDAKKPRVIRAMIDRWAAGLPFISTFFGRLGSVVGAPDNAKRLLEREEAVLVFPEGIRGISKPFTKRYQLQDFGHGFMRIALASKTPILPVAVVGAEEQYINVGNADFAAKLVHAPVCPIIPQVFLPLGQLPLPTKYRVFFGEPLQFEGDADEDDARIGDKVFLVRQAIQTLLNDGLRQRRGVFF
jgi:1-acyl-sn-glycerol-3-phosphate acyltransferase